MALGGARYLAHNVAFALALIVPAGLLGGAVFTQFVLGLSPCEMCYWQRWPHWAALAFALLALAARKEGWSDFIVYLAAISIAISGLIGGFHAGVEYGWWEGVTSCASMSAPSASSAEMLDTIMNAPLVRCDQPQWTLWGISLAGFNFVISVGSALLIWLLVNFSRTKAGASRARTL